MSTSGQCAAGGVIVRDPNVNSRRRELMSQKYTTNYTILKDSHSVPSTCGNKYARQQCTKGAYLSGPCSKHKRETRDLVTPPLYCTLLEKYWQISLYLNDDDLAKLHVT